MTTVHGGAGACGGGGCKAGRAWRRGRRLAAALFVLAGVGSGRADAGLRVAGSAAPRGAASAAPLEGPLTWVVLTITDERSPDDLDWYATAHLGVDGSRLPGATRQWVPAILDSGASTHLVGASMAAASGLDWEFLTGNTFPASGICGSAELEVTMPVGFFVHGPQSLLPGGLPDESIMVGQANFACGAEWGAGLRAVADVPTVLGAPFFAYFPTVIRHSQPVTIEVEGETVTTPSVEFFLDPEDPGLPQFAHRLFMQVSPGGQGGLVSYIAFPDDEANFVPLIPSVLDLGSLFFTASEIVFDEGLETTRGRMLVDTGAQGTIISQIAAAELGLDLRHPEFEVEVQGFACSVMAPGFYIDRVRAPALGGSLTWDEAPVLVLNMPGPSGETIFGILGTNLFGDRDLVFNGAAAPPYLDVSEPIERQELAITAVRFVAPDRLEFDWLARPARAGLRLEAAAAPDGAGGWTAVAVADLPTVTGTMTVTEAPWAARFFRLYAP